MKSNNYKYLSKPKLLGHKDVCNIMIYIHITNKGGFRVHSPLG